MRNKKRNIEKQKALEISVKEGSAASASSNLGDFFITPFAVELQSTPLQIGFLSAFPALLAPLAQNSGSKLMEKHSRKQIVMRFVLLQAIMWLSISALSFLFWKGIYTKAIPLTLIILYSILSILGGLGFPSWFSWMGDLVPEKERGKYFSKRNRIIGSIGLAVALIGSFILDAFKTKGLALLGFSAIFALAFLFRFISYRYFTKQYSPKFKLDKKYYFSLLDFIRKNTNYVKFATYQALFHLTFMIASPFFAVYMLRELNFSPITYTIVTMSGTLFYLISAPLAGKFSDKYGNLKLLLIGGFLFSITPVTWLFLTKPIWIILIPQLIGGMASAAFIIATTNFTYDAVTPERRGICVAYTNILTGIGILIGSLIGGVMLNYISLSLINTFFLVFLISGLLRFTITLIFSSRIKEVKPVEKLPHVMSLTNPLRLVHTPLIWFRTVIKRNTNI